MNIPLEFQVSWWHNVNSAFMPRFSRPRATSCSPISGSTVDTREPWFRRVYFLTSATANAWHRPRWEFHDHANFFVTVYHSFDECWKPTPFNPVVLCRKKGARVCSSAMGPWMILRNSTSSKGVESSKNYPWRVISRWRRCVMAFRRFCGSSSQSLDMVAVKLIRQPGLTKARAFLNFFFGRGCGCRGMICESCDILNLVGSFRRILEKLRKLFFD